MTQRFAKYISSHRRVIFYQSKVGATAATDSTFTLKNLLFPGPRLFSFSSVGMPTYSS